MTTITMIQSTAEYECKFVGKCRTRVEGSTWKRSRAIYYF